MQKVCIVGFDWLLFYMFLGKLNLRP